MPHQGRSTHDSAPPLKGTPPYSRFEGDPTDKSDRLLQWHAENGHENFLFTDDKFFTIEEYHNNQTNKIYAQTSLEVHSGGAGMSSTFLRHGFMGVVPSGGDTSSFLLERGESGVRVYQEDVLQWSEMGLPAGLSSCPKAKTTQEWLRKNVPAFISAEDWPSGSPDLNPRDYKLWAVFEYMACQKCHNNLDSLKRSIVKAAAEIPLETVRPR